MTNDSDTGDSRGTVPSSSSATYREETLDFEEDYDITGQDLSASGENKQSDNDDNDNIDVDNEDDGSGDVVVDDDGSATEDDDEDDEDDDEDDDETEDDEEEEEEEGESNSQISDSEPTCYICLNAFEGQDIGAPESCEAIHEFCFECIEEWSKRVNTCPIDRREFSYIILRKEPGGETVSKVPVAVEPVVEDEIPFNDVTYCEVCNQCNREDRLLLCDGCDLGYHCECLSPPLEHIPIDEWFCPVCNPVIRPEDEPESEEDNFVNNIENSPEPARRRTRQQQSIEPVRRIARTGIFEMVRNRIASRRTRDTATKPTRSRSKSRSKSRSRSTSKTRKRKSTAGKKKRKTPKKRSKSKKRTTKSRKSARRLPPNRKQIAQKLNICRLPKSHHGLPTMAQNSQNCSGSSSSSREVSGFSLGRSVSLFGSEKDFFEVRSYEDSFTVESQDEFNGDGVGIVTSSPAMINLGRIRKPIIPASTRTNSVVDSLLSTSNLLFEKAHNIFLGRDGKIHLHDEMKNVKKTANGTDSNNTSSNNNNNNNISNESFNTSDNKPTDSEKERSLNDNNNSGSLYSQNFSQKNGNSSNNGAADFKNNDDSNGHDNYDDSNDGADINDVDDDDENIDGIEMNDDDIKKIHDKSEDEKKKDEKDTINENNDDQKTKNEDGNNNVNTRKKNPSVKDLFGGDDSDEEIDDDLRRRIIEKGGVDPHFPIKLPIIFKTNFQETQKKIDEEQEVSISKKWISIAPEPIPKSKADGPKWKSIEEPSTSTATDFLPKESETNTVTEKKERARVTFLSPKREENEPQKKSGEKIRICKHGKIRKGKKRESKSVKEEEQMPLPPPPPPPAVTVVEDTIVKNTSDETDIPKEDDDFPFNDDSLENLLNNSAILGDLTGQKLNDKQNDKKQSDEIVMPNKSKSPEERRKRKDDKDEEDRDRRKRRFEEDEDRRRRRDIENIDDDRDKRRRRDDDEDRDRRRRDDEDRGDRERRRERKRSRERSPDRRDRRIRSRSRDRRERSRRDGSRHRSTKDDKRGGRRRTRSRTPEESRHRSSRHRSRHHRSRDRSRERERSYDRHERSLERIRDRKRDRDHRHADNVLKVDMKFEQKPPKTPEEIETPPPAPVKQHNDNTQVIANRLNNFLPKNLDKKNSEPRNDSPFRNITKQIISFSATTTKIDITRTPIRDESPSSSGPSKRSIKDDIFYDADYPQELRDGMKIDDHNNDHDNHHDDDAPYSPGYSPTTFEPTSSMIKPDTIKPFTESQMSDILALAQQTLRNSNHLESPLKNKRPETRDNTELVDMDVESDSDNGHHFDDGGGSIFSDGSYEPSESNRLVDAWEKIQAKAPEQFKEVFKVKNDSKGHNDKYFEKLHRQERVATEVKRHLKPFFDRRKISKDDYKQILKKAVTKICQNKKGIIQSSKIQKLVEDYVARFRHLNKKRANGVAK